jgi:hypothetical protein
MLHNKRRKSKGENFFILLIFTARNDAYAESVFRVELTDKSHPEHGFHFPLISFLADERRHVEIVNTRIRHHRTR